MTVVFNQLSLWKLETVVHSATGNLYILPLFFLTCLQYSNLTAPHRFSLRSGLTKGTDNGGLTLHFSRSILLHAVLWGRELKLQEVIQEEASGETCSPFCWCGQSTLVINTIMPVGLFRESWRESQQQGGLSKTAGLMESVTWGPPGNKDPVST